MNLESYPGAKSGSGIIQWLINNIPPHSRYFELFAGSAQLYKAKRTANQNYLCDIDKEVFDALRKEKPRDFIIYMDDAIHILAWLHYSKDDFIYLDPPYPKIARRTGKKYYKHEMMEEDDHVKLLTAILQHPANIMISTRQNDLYDRMLPGWRKETFQTVDRAGKTEEVIYCNYDIPKYLHQYDYVGQGFSDRQRVKRKIDRFAKKIAMLPGYERHLFIQEIIKKDAAEVKMFLAMIEAK